MARRQNRRLRARRDGVAPPAEGGRFDGGGIDFEQHYRSTVAGDGVQVSTGRKYSARTLYFLREMKNRSAFKQEMPAKKSCAQSCERHE